MNQLQQPINYTNHYMIQQFFKSNLYGVPHDLIISYNPQILGRLPYYSQYTNFHYHGQVNSKVKLIQNPKSTLTINPISQFIVHREHGIVFEIISLNPNYSEPCRLTHHLYPTRITYLNPNLMSNENFYTFPSSHYRNINYHLSISPA